MKNRILSLIVLTVLFFSIAISCDREVKVKDVSLDRTSISIKVGQSTTLVATVTPEKATNKAVVFSSNNILVATVLPTGLVTGISKGTTTILATTVDGGFIATCYVSVKEDTPDVPVVGVTLNKAELTVPVGGTETLIATVLPDSATNKKVTFSSSDATTASVDAQGVVTGKKEGTAIITVTTTEGGFTAKCDVTVG